MRNILWLSFACLAASFALVACAKTSMGGGSSETHFLALCNASCDDGLSCVCGVCTEACTSNSACSDLGDGASCEATADGCGMAMACDVECNDDDDCESLGARYACDGGHCRAPLADPDPTAGSGGAGGMGGGGATSGAGGTAGAGSPPCTVENVVKHLLGDGAIDDCNSEDWSPTERASCAQQRVTNEQPFAVSWDEQGIDSELKSAIVGVPDDSGYYVAKVFYDSAGFVGDFHEDMAWNAQWHVCDVFAVRDTCDQLADCFDCTENRTQVCGCGPDKIFGECSGYAAIPPEECSEPSCLIDGICYPNGETTEDGCCNCEDGEYSCIEPGWCPGWRSISQRCSVDDGCGEGLVCWSKITGGGGVCTRTCNYGCPTGTECVADVPEFGGDAAGTCLLPCETSDDCVAIGVGTSLGSECVVVPEQGSYCL